MTVSAASRTNRPAHRHQRGFTLLEMTIVLAIVGILIGVLAPIGGRILQSSQRSGTVDRLERIEEALIAFLRDNERLPCPTAPNGNPFGVERASCNTGSNMNGIVPFSTLGLSQSDATDSFGNFITYHVAEDYADPAISTSIIDFCLITKPITANPTPDESLSILDENENEITADEVPYILVSHGSDGLGRYVPPATAKIQANGTFQIENANTDEIFVDTGLIESTGIDGPFDDLVAWKSRDELVGLVRENGCNLGDVDAVTEDNLDRVEAAIVAFLRRHGRIPCPAQPEDDPPLGVENTPNCDANDEKGIVPFRTLGLSQNYAHDGYGRLFTYYVTHEYTETNSLASFCTENESDAIRVVDGDNDDVVDDYDATPLVYVLVSHGTNGFGAFVAGSVNPANANSGVAAEDENADNDGDFVDSPPITTGSNAGYDDVTRWQTRDIIAMEAGGCP